MSQKISILLLDDIDGSEATETVTFGLDGTNYEIDLNARNADRLRKALDPFIVKARKVRGGSARRPRKPRGTGPAKAAADAGTRRRGQWRPGEVDAGQEASPTG